MLSTEGIRRVKGEYQKPLYQPLSLVDPIPENIRTEYGLVMTSCLRYLYHRYQEEKNMLIGRLETSFNNLLYIKSVICKETKDGEDYCGKMCEGIRIEKNGAKKVVSLALQAKEWLEQLKYRASL